MRTARELSERAAPRRRCWRAVVLLVALACATTSVQAADVVLVIADGANRGFNDPAPTAPVGGNDGETLGAQRRIAFSHAAAIIGSRIDSRVPIRIRASFDRGWIAGAMPRPWPAPGRLRLRPISRARRAPTRSILSRWPTRCAVRARPIPTPTSSRASTRRWTATTIVCAAPAGTTASTAPHPTVSPAL